MAVIFWLMALFMLADTAYWTQQEDAAIYVICSMFMGLVVAAMGFIAWIFPR
jgi:hypothetical protein